MDAALLVALLTFLFGVPAAIVAIFQINDRVRKRKARTTPYAPKLRELPLLEEDVAPPYYSTRPVPYYPQPRETSHLRLAAILISVALLLVIGVGAVIIVSKIPLGFISSPTPTAASSTPTATSVSTTNTPEQLINDFCRGLQTKDYGSAYANYSKHLQVQVSYTDFVNYWSANNKQYYYFDRCDHQPIPTPSGSSITASWSTHEFFSNQIQHYRVTFVIQGNEWKIDQIVSA